MYKNSGMVEICAFTYRKVHDLGLIVDNFPYILEVVDFER